MLENRMVIGDYYDETHTADDDIYSCGKCGDAYGLEEGTDEGFPPGNALEKVEGWGWVCFRCRAAMEQEAEDRAEEIEAILQHIPSLSR